MFLRIELLSRDPHRVVRYVDLRNLGSNSQLNSSHDFELPWFKRDAGRVPIGKILGSNADFVRDSRRDVAKLEGSARRCCHNARITAVQAFQRNLGIWYWITIYIEGRADDGSESGSDSALCPNKQVGSMRIIASPIAK